MRKTLFFSLLVVTAGFVGMAIQVLAESLLGYTDTPMLPSGKWHVHDPNRPKPALVTPGERFSQGAPAPADAIVLFDGKDLSQWEGVNGAPPPWTIHDGIMDAKVHSGDIHTKESFGDCQLHVEFAEPGKDAPGDGNSGVFLQGLYELQIFDNEATTIYADGQCGALYGQSPCLVNACKKPGEWQSFDIVFEPARWNESHQLARPAMITVFQNGILIHYHQPLLGPTGHRILGKYTTELPATGPVELQEHGDPVRFRNIWIRRIQEEEKP
ncbi:MAG: DUF1080 domain-containing protein [Limisphaerales bacterium]